MAKIVVEFDMILRTAEGFGAPTTVDEAAEWIKDNWLGSDIEEGAVSVDITGVEIVSVSA